MMTTQQLACVQKLATSYERRGQRPGQALFNACYTVNPKVADAARGSEIDPFYDDSRIGMFYVHMLDTA